MVVVVVFVILVGLAIWGTSAWRLASMRSYVLSGNTFANVFFVGMVRTVVIFGGLTLIPILGVIAAGADLREEPGYTFTGPVWPLLVLVAWAAYNYATLRRLHDRVVADPYGT
jgi:hypothetical protein